MKTFAITLLLVGALVGGCAQHAEVYSITFRSIAGDILATGTIELNSPLPSAGEVRATYHLKMKHVSSTQQDVIWFYRLFRAKEEGEVEWKVRPEEPEYLPYSLDFTPGLSDANIGASAGLLKEGKAKGTWSYGIMQGGYEAGEFAIEKK